MSDSHQPGDRVVFRGETFVAVSEPEDNSCVGCFFRTDGMCAEPVLARCAAFGVIYLTPVDAVTWKLIGPGDTK